MLAFTLIRAHSPSPPTNLITQLGCSFFQTLATELAAQDYGRAGVEQWFRPLNRADSWAPGSTHSHAARAVLIDMEPKVGG